MIADSCGSDAYEDLWSVWEIFPRAVPERLRL
jgi:hypothetical protein